MQQKLGWLLLLLFFTMIKCVNGYETFIGASAKIDDSKIQSLESFRNKTYQLPLYQKRYITVRMSPEEFREMRNDTAHVIGFKFQIKSTVKYALEVRKVVEKSEVSTTNLNGSGAIVLDDLYILSKRNALNQIFNAYPSPTLIQIDQLFTDDIDLDTVWSIEAIYMDMTDLTIALDVFFDDDSLSSYSWNLNVLVIQPKRTRDTVFLIILPFLVLFISVQMGILLDTTVLLSIAKKPLPVLVGFVAQYGLMPFLAMGIAKIFRYTPLDGLALFVIGCCPGSGASNQWTLIFDGDVNLSAVMSFVSTASSFVMMPLYFYTLGRIYMDELSIKVPFLGLLRSLALVVVPYAIGITISHFSPKTNQFVKRYAKLLMLLLLVFFLTFVVYVNWYMFLMIDLYLILTAPLLPYLGFVIGAFLAWICRLPWVSVKTIGIEAGIQNTGIAFMIIFFSFPQPFATQALRVPIAVSLLTSKPFWIIYLIRRQMQKYKKRKELKRNELSTIDGEATTINDEKPSANNHYEPEKKIEEIVEMMQNL